MATNQTSVTVSANTTYALPISYSTLTLIDGVDAQEQLLVFRTSIETRSGLSLSLREYRDFGQISSSWLTLDEINKTITAITIPPSATFTLDNGTTVSYPAMSAAEPLLVLRKNVISEPYVEWTTGSRITADQLNLNTAHLLGLIQEVEYVAEQAISRTDNDSMLNPMVKNLDANKFRIIDIGSPVSSTDAATKGYIDGLILSNLTNKLGAASGIATLDANGTLTAGQIPTLAVLSSTFFSGASAPVRSAGNLYNYGSLWYNTTNGRLYVYLFDDRYSATNPATTEGDVGYWVDVASPAI